MLFEYNFYSTLLLPSVIHGMLFTFLLCFRSWKESRLSDVLLAILIFLFTIRIAAWMLGFAGWYDVRDWHTTFMFYVQWNHVFAFGPLVYFYFKSVTNHQFRFTKKDSWHLILPSIAVISSTVIFFRDIVLHVWWMGEELPIFHGTNGEWNAADWGVIGTVLEYLAPVSVLAYFSYTFYLFYSYRRYIAANFSTTEHISFNWLRNFLLAYLVAQVVWYFFMFIESFNTGEMNYVNYWYSYFAWGLVVYYLGIAGYQQRQEAIVPLQFEGETETHSEKAKETVSSLADEEEEILTIFYQQLETYLEQEKPYLLPNLSLRQLAKNMNESATQISNVINQKAGTNFNDYINQWRVNAVKEKIVSDDFNHLSLLGIAFDCGFSSKATFNRAFKKTTGLSPSAYRKEQAQHLTTNPVR